MNGNQDLTALAGDPRAFDTELAGLHKQRDAALARVKAAEDRAHRVAGDKRSYQGRRQVWGRHIGVIETQLDSLAKNMGNSAAGEALTTLRAARDEVSRISLDIIARDEIYRQSPWTRFFPSVTKSHPHIHATLGCRTLHHDTVMNWAPGLSGKTEAEAVTELDEALCTVCFPTAPVALHNYVSRRTTGRIHRATCKHIAKGADRLSPAQAGVDALLAASRATCCSARETDRDAAVTTARDAAAAAEAEATAAAPVTRPGELRAMVEAHLTASPGQSFTPYRIGKALQRSSGAVTNALAKLATLGTAELVAAKPLTYRAAGRQTA